MTSEVVYQVFHNNSTDPWRFLSGYRAGDPLELVCAYTYPADEDVQFHLESIWIDRNCDDPNRKTRSLSVGDVVCIYHAEDKRLIAAYSCDAVGWSPIQPSDLEVSA